MRPVSYQRTEPWQILNPSADFFDRESGKVYVDLLDNAESVTIYVGAGVSADLGAPLSDQLMRFLLKEWAKGHDFLEKLPEEHRRTEADPRAAVLDQVVEALRNAYPPAYIGSIVRSLADQKKHEDEGPDSELIQQIEHATRAGVDTGGFLARSVIALAFALKRANVDVTVLTTNYDPTMTRPDERRKVVNYFAQYFTDCDYEFAVLRSSVSDTGAAPNQIPLAYLNGVGPHSRGTERDTPVVGEADFFLPGLAAPDTASEYMRWRDERMQVALAADICLFVGSSLSDPDVLRSLALTKDQGPRYAVVLAPDREERAGGFSRLNLPATDLNTGRVSRAIARDLMCQRYLHLGVQPIMVDHPYQVPQLLTELALKKVEPRYEPYRQRLDRWWVKVAAKFGFEVDGSTAAERPGSEQEQWRELLGRLKATIRDEFASGEHPEHEQIMVEVWVHNPKEHQLFLWATSESLWLYNDTAHQCGIEEEDSRFGQQGAFRRGGPRVAHIKPQRGRWKYHVSIPLTLHGHQWHHLPVGVVSVLSSEERGWLYAASQGKDNVERLEALLQEPINNELDPEGALDD